MRTLLLGFLLLPSITHLHSEAYEILAYSVEIHVSNRGFFDVKERLDVEFLDQRRGIIRSIPEKYAHEGKRLKVKINNIQVEDWNFKTYREGGYQQIRIGQADVFVTGFQTYEITYRVEGAFLWFADRTEFYWNVVGHEWDVPIRDAEFRIYFPDGAVSSQEDVLLYTGAPGVRGRDATLAFAPDKVIGKTTRVLEPGEGVTVAALMPPEMISTPARKDRSNSKSGKDFTFILPLALAGMLAGAWRRWGRNTTSSKPIPHAFYPPDNISAAEVGTFYDNTANQRDVLALIPEWGQQGLLKIRALTQDDGHDDDDLFIERVKVLPSDRPEYEQLLFDKLFQRGDLVLLSSLKNEMAGTLMRTRHKLKKHVLRLKLLDANAYRIFHSGWMILTFFLSLALGFVLILVFGKIFGGILTILLGFGAFTLHFLSPKRSEEGVQLMQHLRGFRKFLEDGPPEKIDELVDQDPMYFEKVFPFAVAYGLDKEWTKRFESTEMSAPSWYYFDDVHSVSNSTHMGHFSSNFTVKTVSSAFGFQSIDPGSGSAGSFSGGGGGFSGGGFGGGGGSSW